MDNNFNLIKLNNLVNRVKVGFVGTCEKYYCSKEEGFPIIRTTDLIDNGIDFSNLKYITKEFYNKEKKSQLNKGDLLIARHGDNGKAKIYKKNFPAQALNVVIIEPNQDKMSSYLLKCFFETSFVRNQIFNSSSGSIQNVVNTKTINDLLIPISTNINYKIIGKLLEILEYKVELNNQINQKLEAMAKTLYDYWFIQFDFPNSKGRPYKSSGGKMVYSEELKREIPEGWGVDTLNSFIKMTKGGDWGKENIEDNYTKEVFCIRGADFNELNGKGELKAPTRYILEKNTNKLLTSHDIIIEISGGSPTQSTGRLTFITKETLNRFDKAIVCSNFCRAISLNEKKDLYYFVHTWNLLYDNNVMFSWEGKTSGLRNLLLNNMLKSVNIIVPSRDLIDKFYEFNKPLQAKKQKNLIENQKLTQLRNWLLPMLMNGQVKVR